MPEEQAPAPMPPGPLAPPPNVEAALAVVARLRAGSRSEEDIVEATEHLRRYALLHLASITARMQKGRRDGTA